MFKLSASPVSIVGFFKNSAVNLLRLVPPTFYSSLQRLFLMLGCRREWFLTTADWPDSAGLAKMAAPVFTCFHNVNVHTFCFPGPHSRFFKTLLLISCRGSFRTRYLCYFLYLVAGGSGSSQQLTGQIPRG